MNASQPLTRLITALFDGDCVCCAEPVKAGDKIYHRPGKAMHQHCGDRRREMLREARAEGRSIPTPAEMKASAAGVAMQNFAIGLVGAEPRDNHREPATELQNPPAGMASQLSASDLDAPRVATYNTKVADGTYTVVVGTEHRTFMIETAPADSKFAGKRIFSLMTGSDNENDYRGVGFVLDNGRLAVWGRLQNTDLALNAQRAMAAIVNLSMERREEAGLAYAIRSSRCRRCRRKLTVPTSIHQGYGPECVKHVGH